jgi:methyl-accepting chemotaxis protein
MIWSSGISYRVISQGKNQMTDHTGRAAAGKEKVMIPAAFRAVKSIESLKYLLFVTLLIMGVMVTTFILLAKNSGSLNDILRENSDSHAALEKVRENLLNLPLAFQPDQDTGDKSPMALSRRINSLESTIKNADLQDYGAPQELVTSFIDSLSAVRERLSGGRDLPQGVNPDEVVPPSMIRSLVKQWMVIEGEINKRNQERYLMVRENQRRTSFWLMLLMIFLLVVAGLTTMINLRRSSVSLKKLIEASQTLGSGDFSHRVAILGSDDLKDVMDNFNRMASDIEQWRNQSMAIKETYELRMGQVVRFLKEASSGGELEGLPEVMEPSARDLVRAVNSFAQIHSEMSVKLEAAEKHLANWRLSLDQDAVALSLYIKTAMGKDRPPPPHISEKSPLHSLAEECRVFVEKMRGTIDSIEDAARNLYQSSSEIIKVSEIQEKELSDEYLFVHETSASVNEGSVKSKQSNQMVEQVFESSQEAMETAEGGREIIDEVMESMVSINSQVEEIAGGILNLSDKSREIDDIVQTFSDISKQTNLLALNAAIEAAGVGEHGKGFAVVAKEIRNLASRSALATGEIEKLIDYIRQAATTAVVSTEKGSKRVDHGVEMVNSLKESFERIIDKFNEVVESAYQISQASKEQTVGARQVSSAIVEIDRMMKGSLKNIQHFRTLVTDYQKITESLRKLTGELGIRD